MLEELDEYIEKIFDENGNEYLAVRELLCYKEWKIFNNLNEDEKRLYRRKQTKDGNKLLYKIVLVKGVKNFDKFTNAGYKGL